MHKAMLAAFSGALWASSAQAADVNLVPIGSSADGASWSFVDRASVETAGATRTYWVLWANTGRRSRPARSYLLCDAALHRRLRGPFLALHVRRFYERGGRALSHADPHVDAAPIVPGTLGADIEGLVCKGEAPIVAQGFGSIDDAVSWARKQAK